MPYFCGSRSLSSSNFVMSCFGQRAARAFGEEGVLAAQLHAAHEVVGWLPVTPNAHVAGRHADHRTIVVVENLGGRKARIDLDAELGRLLAEPDAQRAQADDVVAVVAHQRGHEEVRHAERAVFRQNQELVGLDLGVDGGTLLLPVRHEPVETLGIDDGTRQDMGADSGALFQHHHRDLSSGLGRELLQADGGSQAGRPRAHDDDVELHRLSGRQRGFGAGHTCLLPRLCA